MKWPKSVDSYRLSIGVYNAAGVMVKVVELNALVPRDVEPIEGAHW